MTISVGGLTAFSATDYPGNFSAVVFCQGCPWRCRYCHNPHLIPTKVNSDLSLNWAQIYHFLQGRKNLLDAVVFSGGEPTLQRNLHDAIEQVKLLGFQIGLHTSGACPNGLNRVLPLVDWIGFDIKASRNSYSTITQISKSGKAAWKNLDTLLASNVDYEVRSTIHPLLHSRDEIIQIAKILSSRGVKKYVLQEFRTTGSQDQELNAHISKGYLDQELINELAPLFSSFEIRRA